MRNANSFVFTTNLDLLKMANEVNIEPHKDCSVFYHGTGATNAAEFIRKNPSKKYTRLDELLNSPTNTKGRRLWSALIGAYSGTQDQRWSETAEVWYTLSARFAENSSGDVHAFGDIPSRSDPDKNLTGWECRHQPFYFANTVFEKVEAQILLNNSEFDRIYYNNKIWPG